MLPPMWIMALLHFWVCLNLYVILERALRKSEGPQRLLPRVEGEQAWTSCQHMSLLRTSPWILHCWLKISISLTVDTPCMIGWIIGGRGYQTSSARKITHPSIILALGKAQPHKSPRIRVKAMALSHACPHIKNLCGPHKFWRQHQF